MSKRIYEVVTRYDGSDGSKHESQMLFASETDAQEWVKHYTSEPVEGIKKLCLYEYDKENTFTHDDVTFTPRLVFYHSRLVH